MALDPRLAVPLLNRCVVRLRQGDLDGALADADRGIELAPGQALGYCNRGLVRAAP